MKGKNGEHPFGDAGQLILLVLFLILWIADSFGFFDLLDTARDKVLLLGAIRGKWPAGGRATKNPGSPVKSTDEGAILLGFLSSVFLQSFPPTHPEYRKHPRSGFLRLKFLKK